jgi:hypothetical protein
VSSLRRSAGAGFVLCALLVGACGSSKPSISATASATLVGEVARIRAAVTSNDPAAAHAQLAQLRATVAALEAQGQLSGSRATTILATAAEVDTQLGPEATNPPATTTTAPPPDQQNGNGNGKGKGGDSGD